MSSDRLHSYFFNCPCCNQTHLRLFEYYAKFYGLIPDNVPLSHFKTDVSMLERVVMDEENFAGRSVGIGESTFRCGNCNEFFKFDDYISEPKKLNEDEKRYANCKFKPITMLRENAIKNAFEMLVKLTHNRGYQINAETGEISFKDGNGKEYKFKIGEELISTFYGDNKNFKVQPYDLVSEYLKSVNMEA